MYVVLFREKSDILLFIGLLSFFYNKNMSFFYIEKNYVRKQKELSLIGMTISLSYKKVLKDFSLLVRINYLLLEVRYLDYLWFTIT